MKKIIILIILFYVLGFSLIKAQDSTLNVQNNLKLGGELTTDQRILLKEDNKWVWNENRLNLQLNKKNYDNYSFYSEIWLRYIDFPSINKISDLYNKSTIDPYSIELREAYLQINHFLTKNIDIKIGRQKIIWGTADKFNPTSNLNPYDLEDIFNFGNYRASDALNLNYYINNDFSIQGIYIPFFQAANLPIGIFSNVLNPKIITPTGTILNNITTNVVSPEYNLAKSSKGAFKFKGNIKNVDFSLSYVWAYDCLPTLTKSIIIPVDTMGNINIMSELNYYRNHIIGADIATSIAGIGLWAEAAAYLPEKDITMTNNLSALYPNMPTPVIIKETILKKSEPYIKFVIGGDYHFADNSYLNVQYLHGFIHEKGKENLNDYMFIKYEKRFLRDKLIISPLAGAFIVSNWDDLKNNYSIAYLPQISYKPIDDIELNMSTAIMDGKGENLFSKIKSYNMLLFKMKYYF
ncbi:MAG TPA: hypothetical protein P5250_02885 [Bacteroidales bacterium]|nr:hypothetical protein [Bacteroidales bacterium]